MDWVRLLAAVAVIYTHSWALIAGAGDDPISRTFRAVSPFRLGLAGLAVGVFFALSGYLVVRSWVSRPGLPFLVGRVGRIHPPLIVAVLLSAGVGMLVTTLGPVEYATAPGTLRYVGWNSSGLRFLGGVPGVAFEANGFSVNGSLWTISGEFRLYLLVALAGMLGLLRRTSTVLVAMVALAAAHAFLDLGSTVFELAGHLKFLPFFFGGVAYHEATRAGWSLRGTAVVVAAVALVAVLDGGVMADPALAFALGLLVVHATARSSSVRPVPADISYGVYLLAFPIQQLLLEFTPVAGPWELFVWATLLTIVAAAVLHVAVERPAACATRVVRRRAEAWQGTVQERLRQWRGARRDRIPSAAGQVPSPADEQPRS